MDPSQRQQHTLYTLPPISPGHDYLPKRSTLSVPSDKFGSGPPVRAHNDPHTEASTRLAHPFGDTAPPAYLNGNASSANQRPSPSMSHNTTATTAPAAVV